MAPAISAVASVISNSGTGVYDRGSGFTVGHTQYHLGLPAARRRLRAHFITLILFSAAQAQLASDDYNFLEINDFENSSMRLPLLLLLLNYNQAVISFNYLIRKI